jgi:hypothetical protein
MGIFWRTISEISEEGEGHTGARGDSKDIFLVAALLSAGALLRFILVLFGELITPNVIVAFYSLAIMLILPSFGEAIGIGLVEWYYYCPHQPVFN